MADLEITAVGVAHVTAKILNLTLRELALLGSVMQDHEMGARDGDCSRCRGSDGACPECQELADLAQKIIDLESLVAFGVLGIIQIDPAFAAKKGGE
jgi:hypothetical protein